MGGDPGRQAVSARRMDFGRQPGDQWRPPAKTQMNDEQKLWWEQAKSDHTVLVLLRRRGVHECHVLHYLQMAAEKIAKAYLWRTGRAPLRSHVGLMPFLQAL